MPPRSLPAESHSPRRERVSLLDTFRALTTSYDHDGLLSCRFLFVLTIVSRTHHSVQKLVVATVVSFFLDLNVGSGLRHQLYDSIPNLRLGSQLSVDHVVGNPETIRNTHFTEIVHETWKNKSLSYQSAYFVSSCVCETRSQFTQKFTTTPRASNTSEPSPVTLKPKKKRGIIQRTLFYSTLLVLTAYGVGTAAAVNNEHAHDYFLDNVPLAEHILDYVESKGYVGGLPHPPADPSSTHHRRHRRPTPSPAPSPEPPKKHEKIEAFKAKVEGKVKEKKERIRTVASQLPTTVQKGPPHGPTPANISSQLPAPLPPKSYSEGVEELVNEVKSVLKGDLVSLAEERHERELAQAKEAEQKTGPVRAEATPPPAAPVKEPESPEDPQGRKWYHKTPLPLGFEPPPGYAVPPPKEVPKTSAGLLLVAPAVAEFTESEPLLNQLATTVDKLAKYLEDNPKAEKGVNRILDVAKKDLADLGTKIESVKKESKEKLEKSLEEQTREYSVKLLEAELSARDKLDSQDQEWRHYFEQERLSLLQKYQEKLENELETQKDLINER